MGVFSTPPEGASDDSVAEDTEDSAGAEEQRQAAEQDEPRPVTVPIPKATGRRAQAAQKSEALEKKFSELEQKYAKHQEDYNRQLSERDQQIARLMGGMEAMHANRGPASQQPAEPEDQRLMREATEFLEKGRFDKYQEKLLEAAETRALNKFKAQQTAQPQAMPQAMQMEVMANIGRFPKLAENPQRALQMATIKESELCVLYQTQSTPEIRAKAFELANEALGGSKQGAASFSPNGRSVLAGIPAGRGNGGAAKAEPSVELPANWERWQKGSGMSREDYVQEYIRGNPGSVKE